jgi:hypothetical protein
LGESTEDTTQYLFSQCFTVGISGGVERFVLMVMVVDTGNATSAACWKFLPTKSLHLKDQSALPNVNQLDNALWLCNVAVYPEITN